MALRSIHLCAGYGGIELGLGLLGLELEPMCYVEIEAVAAAGLVAKMEQGLLAEAPVWSDVHTFPSHLFSGRVDIVTGGFPCQPFSHAGVRRGADDPRHLWPSIARILGELRPRLAFFENVEGHLTLGFDSVVQDLERLGYRVAAGVFSAAEVGANHGRKRLFILGELDDAEGSRWRLHDGAGSGSQSGNGLDGANPDVDDAQSGQDDFGGPGIVEPEEGRESGRQPTPADASGQLAHPFCVGPRGRDYGHRVREGEQSGPQDQTQGPSGQLADADGAGPQGRNIGGDGGCERAAGQGRPCLFPPGPGDFGAWTRVLASRPDLTPANEKRDRIVVAARRLYRLLAPGVNRRQRGQTAKAAFERAVRGMADGAAGRVGDRTDHLRLLGNGVVPMVAGYAFATLYASLIADRKRTGGS